jgi:ABC-2 type transport system ATP-binding protein
MNKAASFVIEIADLRVAFTSRKGRIAAVDGLHLRVSEGEVVGFIGPNGAGKTTTIKVLMGFLPPEGGQVRVFGEEPGTVAARRRIGYLPEVARYYPFLSARETLQLYATLSGLPRARRTAAVEGLLEKVGLLHRAGDRLSGYSKGMLQRLGIAQAILGEPDLLILDEVTSGLDPVARHDLRTLLLGFKQQGKTVFFSSHELSEVAMLCDRILILDEGRIREENTLDEMLRAARTILLRMRRPAPPQELPPGVVLRGSADGVHVYAVDNWETAQRWQATLENQGAEVLEVREEPISLEDYFVRKIGHKVT